MKKILNILFAVVFIVSIVQDCSADGHEPSILVLTPYEVEYEKVFSDEISELDSKIIERFKYRADYDSSVSSSESSNIKIMRQDMSDYVRNINFQKTISYVATNSLIYTFIDKFKNLLITVKDVKCKGDHDCFKEITTKGKFQYVVNVKKLSFYKQLGAKMAKATIQLYDNAVGTIVLEKEYFGDWKNYGFEFSCEENTLECNVNNILAQSTKEIISYVMSHSPTVIRERDLRYKRAFVLKNNYLSKPFDTNFIEKIIPRTDTMISLNLLYYSFVDESKTKFLSFFIDSISKEEYKSRMSSKKENGIQVLHNVDVLKEGSLNEDFFNEVPSLNTYTVNGIYYKGKWYYKKSNITYFTEPTKEVGKVEYFNNLQKWNFFEKNSDKFNQDFWVTNQFGIIRDLTKDSLWSKHGKDLWKSEERENRKYIGMYELVAAQMKDSVKNEIKRKDSIVGATIFIPFYESLLKKYPLEFSKYAFNYKNIIIISLSERNVFISPVMITDSKGEKTLRFFVTSIGEKHIYEWIYFTPKVLKPDDWHFGSDVVDLLSTVTEWNFSFETLDDPKFWNEYVLLKNNGTYMYLKEIHYQ